MKKLIPHFKHWLTQRRPLLNNLRTRLARWLHFPLALPISYFSGLRKTLWWTLKLLLVLTIIIWACNLWIELQTRSQIYTALEQVPVKKVALVLGTVRFLGNGRINRYFQYRIDAAVALYRAGKIKHILVSGDNRTIYYNEPLEMRKALLEQGIPATAITLDYAGFRTLDSVVRAHKVFSLNDFIIVSQGFHNQRALFISQFYGIQAIGFNAQDVSLTEDYKTPVREYFARFKAVLDLYLLKTQPRFLGEKVDIIL